MAIFELSMVTAALAGISIEAATNTNSLRQTSIKGSILKPGGCDQMQDSILIKSGDKGGKLLLYLA